jgi:hypothetical protein
VNANVDAILMVGRLVIGVHGELGGILAGMDFFTQHFDVLPTSVGAVHARLPLGEIALLERRRPYHHRASRLRESEATERQGERANLRAQSHLHLLSNFGVAETMIGSSPAGLR